MNAVVLAGGPPDDVAALEPGAPNKAFVRIGDTALVARVIAALRATPEIERIVVVAPAAAGRRPELAGADEVRPDGPRIGQSLASGLRGIDPGELVLVTAADLPLLDRAAIEEFVAIARARGADLVYACLAKRFHDARFPEVPHTWARLREGKFCGGGLIALRPRALEPLQAFLDRLGSARKNPLALASIFGWRVLWRYAIGRLAIAQAEARASELLGLSVASAPCTLAQGAVNVDRPSDVELARRLVREPAARTPSDAT